MFAGLVSLRGCSISSLHPLLATGHRAWKVTQSIRELNTNAVENGPVPGRREHTNRAAPRSSASLVAGHTTVALSLPFLDDGAGGLARTHKFAAFIAPCLAEVCRDVTKHENGRL